ncbi:unnamed protein product [Rotaria sp. Silwood2]|nr:unnamed protein product [Rotaria sp. Silwood2]CAF3350215.1 unnamed protein product [Rotaria sp. Silwood2]CAF4473828.1 unnamed protein product [Rotaria sp. Silwood2]CAF4476079.1 unnamed protein product [Rotaria sp. Silwood2]CAF4548107.1 unnamed protein product [Rotaria sp. Silwood2]
MVLLLIVAILCSNNVESRIVHGNVEGIPLSQYDYLRFDLGKMTNENSNEDQQENHEEYIHTKRKSELLSSLYGLPYALVGKRNEK